MPKIPRDISAKKLIKALSKFGYKITRQVGSHIRLSSEIKGFKHNITIPSHKEIKIGTINNILNDLSKYLKINKQELIEKLF